VAQKIEEERMNGRCIAGVGKLRGPGLQFLPKRPALLAVGAVGKSESIRRTSACAQSLAAIVFISGITQRFSAGDRRLECAHRHVAVV